MERNYKLNRPFPSDRKYKKLQVYVKNKQGRIVNIHFGDNRYEDYTMHKDLKRRESFRKRHRCDPISKVPKDSARYWACKELW